MTERAPPRIGGRPFCVCDHSSIGTLGASPTGEPTAPGSAAGGTRGVSGAVGSGCDHSQAPVALPLPVVVLRPGAVGPMSKDPAQKLAEATAEARELLREVRGTLKDLQAATRATTGLIAAMNAQAVRDAVKSDLEPRFDQVMAELDDVSRRCGEEVQRRYDKIAARATKETIIALNHALQSLQTDPHRYMHNVAPLRIVLSWREDVGDVEALVESGKCVVLDADALAANRDGPVQW